jgi:AmmeMemoRadiSam system protein B
VAGTFYPRSAAELDAWVSELVTGEGPRGDWVACVAPHAGYVYSGKVAGQVFGHLKVPRRVIVLGPNHTGLGPEVAVASHETWHTPLGPVPVDRELAGMLLEEFPAARLDATAHFREHSIEVQLPFLQHCRPDVTVLPVCLRHLAFDACVDLGAALARVVGRAGEPVGLVASSDMSHFEPDEPTRRRDRLAIDAALTMSPRALYDTVAKHQISMCGVVPATVVMAAAGSLGANDAHLVAYATSAETSGDTTRVVGYAGICFGHRD